MDLKGRRRDEGFEVDHGFKLGAFLVAPDRSGHALFRVDRGDDQGFAPLAELQPSANGSVPDVDLVAGLDSCCTHCFTTSFARCCLSLVVRSGKWDERNILAAFTCSHLDDSPWSPAATLGPQRKAHCSQAHCPPPRWAHRSTKCSCPGRLLDSTQKQPRAASGRTLNAT